VLRIFIAFNLFLFGLFASESDFELCRQKIIDSNAIEGEEIKIPLQNNLLLLYSKKVPTSNIIKYDEELGLYLLKDKTPFKYPFKFSTKNSQKVATVSRDKIVEGISSSIKPSLVMSSCCSIEAISTKSGIVKKEQIDKFLKSKPYEKDDKKEPQKQAAKNIISISGIYFDEDMNVIKLDTAASQYGLKPSDKLLQIDLESVKNQKELSQILLKNKKPSNLLFQRDGFQFFVKLN
jgi:hypothetical protein